jgi:hypothetical protein
VGGLAQVALAAKTPAGKVSGARSASGSDQAHVVGERDDQSLVDLTCA